LTIGATALSLVARVFNHQKPGEQSRSRRIISEFDRAEPKKKAPAGIWRALRKLH
jgi:hypothetical protein